MCRDYHTQLYFYTYTCSATQIPYEQLVHKSSQHVVVSQPSMFYRQANLGMANSTVSAQNDPSIPDSAVIQYEMLPVKKGMQPENV